MILAWASPFNIIWLVLSVADPEGERSGRASPPILSLVGLDTCIVWMWCLAFFQIVLTKEKQWISEQW